MHRSAPPCVCGKSGVSQGTMELIKPPVLGNLGQPCTALRDFLEALFLHIWIFVYIWERPETQGIVFYARSSSLLKCCFSFGFGGSILCKCCISFRLGTSIYWKRCISLGSGRFLMEMFGLSKVLEGLNAKAHQSFQTITFHYQIDALWIILKLQPYI